MTNPTHATTFRNLHAPGQFLVLPNAWDAGSARLIESAGAAAIATSSAAVAWANGYPDGDALPTALLIRTVEQIVRVINVPLSVDSEGGYSDDPAEVAENIYAIANAGAVGINIEEGSKSPDLLCTKIEAAKRGAQRAGVDLFVNARIDILLQGVVPREQFVEETLARAARYRDAGCDGIFVPLIASAEDIQAVARGIDPLPLNVMAIGGLAPTAELRRLGARRLSAGAGIARAAISLTLRLAEEFLRDGNSSAIYAEVKDKTDINALFRNLPNAGGGAGE
ncbi:MAG TPA: isocitrate lyase/phosphoenolpyruvate mutase family protein [Thermoanaerobaculia bacterium]|jgi:2-methylisocitrate lyase-like PEP mutase family enzyme|nr:isocitrate lyase/phosphoenolpyruvate mutase family protein [Thermoanaerobaculia bacterium]